METNKVLSAAPELPEADGCLGSWSCRARLSGGALLLLTITLRASAQRRVVFLSAAAEQPFTSVRRHSHSAKQAEGSSTPEHPTAHFHVLQPLGSPRNFSRNITIFLANVTARVQSLCSLGVCSPEYACLGSYEGKQSSQSNSGAREI